MEKRVRFRSVVLPWLLLLPQLTVIIVFFFWPAAQALLQDLGPKVQQVLRSHFQC